MEYSEAAKYVVTHAEDIVLESNHPEDPLHEAATTIINKNRVRNAVPGDTIAMGEFTDAVANYKERRHG